jgi:hypothetical protein
MIDAGEFLSIFDQYRLSVALISAWTYFVAERLERRL